MQIRLDKAGKRYNREWIFSDWSHTFEQGTSSVILGGNGSGKSTALKCILGYANLSKGSIAYTLQNKTIGIENAYPYFSLCAPYLDIYEELSLMELLKFHYSLRTAIAGISISDMAERMELSHARDKPIKYYSSGMKQRVKLGLAFFTEASCTLLDEPISNLDRKGIDWYLSQVELLRKERLFIVASNQQEEEYAFCSEKIYIEKLKQL
jgi:ABC-type multidrug transport system ATPase subunit